MNHFHSLSQHVGVLARRDDIPLLTDYYLDQFALKYEKPLFKLDQQVRQFLFNVYPWPGNVNNSYSKALCEFLIESSQSAYGYKNEIIIG